MFYLKRNVPVVERGLRVVAGICGAVLAIAYAPMAAGMWAGIVAGAAFAITGLVGYCPMCAMIGRKPVEASK